MSHVKIELENIGVFRERREFRLSKGLNLLYAPNASGKTSLLAGLKAVSISALTPNELSRVLNDYEEKGKVKLVIDGKEYTIELIRKPDGTVEAWGKRLAEDGVIKRIAFIDMENDLVNAIYAGDDERVKSILREVSGVAYIETILNVLEGLGSEYEYSYETKKKEYESRKEEITKQRKRLEERLNKIRSRIREILRDPRIEPARKEIKEIRSKREALLNQQRELRKQEIEVNNRIGLLEHDYTGKKAELDVLKEQREKVSRELRDLERRIVTIRKRIEVLLSEVRYLESRRRNITTEITEKENMIRRRKAVLEYALCPYCGAPINKDRIMKEISKLEEDISKLRKELDEVEEGIRQRIAEVNELREKGEERVSALKAELERLTKRINDLERELSNIESKLNSEKRKLEEIRRQMKLLDEELLILNRKLEVLKDKIPLVEELGRLQDEEQRIVEDLDYLFGRLRQLDQLYSEIKVLKDRVEKVKLLIEYFKIRLNELKRIVIEKINESILKHFKLLKLAELEYPVLAEDFSLTLTRAGGIPTTLAELSDAEKAIFIILMTMALKDYVAEDFPFYVIDTLIEFVDDTRAKEILKYLMEVASENKIVIVTKTKPYTGEPKLLSQEDIIVNKII